MAIEIRPFAPEWIPAIREFNNRLATATIAGDMRLPEDPAAEMLPGSEMFLALQDGQVRGGYVLRTQQFSAGGANHSVAHYRLPLSEGIVNKAYAMVGSQMLRHALKNQPLLYALGMSSFEQPLPRMLKAMGWKLCQVPFYFRIVRPAPFLRNIRPLRGTPLRRLAMDLAAASGAGWIGIQALHLLGKRLPRDYSADVVPNFSDWAGEIWRTGSSSVALAATRDRDALNLIYPPDGRFIRLKISVDGKPAGWALLVDTVMSEDKYFGNMRVATIVDCMAEPRHALAVIAAARTFLEQRGVDLIISNQRHEAWTQALETAGFRQGPSNFIFAASAKLADLLAPFDANVSRVHVNRGDGDGPVHL